MHIHFYFTFFILNLWRKFDIYLLSLKFMEKACLFLFLSLISSYLLPCLFVLFWIVLLNIKLFKNWYWFFSQQFFATVLYLVFKLNSIHSATKIITCVRFCLKQMWWLTKAMAKMKREHWTKRWNWSSCTKLALSASWTHGLIDQLVRASEWNSVVVGSNPTQANFL